MFLSLSTSLVLSPLSVSVSSFSQFAQLLGERDDSCLPLPNHLVALFPQMLRKKKNLEGMPKGGWLCRRFAAKLPRMFFVALNAPLNPGKESLFSYLSRITRGWKKKYQGNFTLFPLHLTSQACGYSACSARGSHLLASRAEIKARSRTGGQAGIACGAF